MKRRALIVCPGRGSYDRSCLGSLSGRSPGAQRVIDACDAWRAQRGLPTVTELDADDAFRGTRHVAGEHASILTFAASLADLADLDRDRYEVVGVVGNSMGFYTALAASGALSLEDAIRLVDTMGVYQTRNVIGGQVLYPIADSDWRRDAELSAAVERARESTGAWWSIDLGSFAVLGASADGVRALLGALPQVTRGQRTFPTQLPLHSAFHTPLMDDTSRRARIELADLRFRRPQVPLVDGRGFVFRPAWADPLALADYTLGHQVVAPFDLATAVRTGLHHCAPDLMVALGPGNSLGGPLAGMLTRDGWGGVADRAGFDAAQASDAPRLLSFGVSLQRRHLVAG